MITFINLTPHAIHLPGRVIEISGKISRCDEITSFMGEIDGVEIVYRRYGKVHDLPVFQKDVFLIVSLLVRQACPDRGDLLSPGDLIRDENGQIIGCKNLVANLVI